MVAVQVLDQAGNKVADRELAPGFQRRADDLGMMGFDGPTNP